MNWPSRVGVVLTMLAATVHAAPATAADTYGWQGATLTATVAGADLGNMTVTDAGQTFAAWTQTVGANTQPEVSRGGKTTPVTWHLDSATATDSQTRIAMAADGSVGFAVYKKMVGADRRLWWSLWNGTAWSAGAQLATSVDANTPPAVDIRDDGTFGVVAWRSSTGSVFARRFSASTFAGADTLTSSASETVSVAVARKADRALISWVLAPSLQLQSRAWGGSSWGALRDVSQNTGMAFSPEGEVEISEDGTSSAAIWSTFTAGQWVARAAQGNGDSWNAPAALHTGGYSALEGLDIALSRNGSSALASWMGEAGGGGQTTYVYRNSWDSGSWGGGIIVAGPYIDGSRPNPDGAISATGNRAVIGYQNRRSGPEYRGQTQLFTGGVWSDFSSMTVASSDPDSGRTQVELTSQGTRGAAVSVQQTGGQQYLKLNTLTVYTVPDPPAAPTAQYLVSGSNSAVMLNWQETGFDGNSPIMDYVVESDPAGPYCAPQNLYLRCMILGMIPGVPYKFRVYATNNRGASAPSDWSNPVTIPVADPGGGTTPGGGGGGGTTAAQPSVKQITVTQKKRKGPRRKVVVRWTSVDATSNQMRITRPGAKKWRKWQEVGATRKVLRLPRGKVYRVSVRAISAAGVSPVLVKRFRVKR